MPPDDRALIDRVLTASRAAAPAAPDTDPDAAGIPLIPDDEIDALAAPAALPDDAYKAHLALADHEDRRCAPGERRPVYVRVTNAGGVRWPWGLDQEPQIRAAYHWRHAGGEVLEHEGLRSPLPVAVGPGETVVVPLWVDAPAVAGTYLLDIDLVHEHVRWFDDPLTVELRVAERTHTPTSGPTGGPDAGPATGTRGAPC